MDMANKGIRMIRHHKTFSETEACEVDVSATQKMFSNSRGTRGCDVDRVVFIRHINPYTIGSNVVDGGCGCVGCY